jgi:hypothetical protein
MNSSNGNSSRVHSHGNIAFVSTLIAMLGLVISIGCLIVWFFEIRALAEHLFSVTMSYFATAIVLTNLSIACAGYVLWVFSQNQLLIETRRFWLIFVVALVSMLGLMGLLWSQIFLPAEYFLKTSTYALLSILGTAGIWATLTYLYLDYRRPDPK